MIINDGQRVTFSEFFFRLAVKSFREIADIAQLSAMVIADRTLSASGPKIRSKKGSAHPLDLLAGSGDLLVPLFGR